MSPACVFLRARLHEGVPVFKAGNFDKAPKSFAIWDSIEDMIKARSADDLWRSRKA
jgi:hypothetical protein